MKSPRPRSEPILLAGAALVGLAAALAGCAPADDHAPPTGDADGGIIGPPPSGGCGTDQGCPCDHPGESVECRAYRKSGDYVACSPGTRLCGADGRWQACVGDLTAK